MRRFLLLLAFAATTMVHLHGFADVPKFKVLARAYQPGEVLMIAMESKTAVEGLKGEFLNRDLSFFPGEKGLWFAFSPIGLHTKPGKYTMKVNGVIKPKQETFVWTHSIEVKDKKFPTRRVSVAKKYVDLSAKELKRVRKETKVLKKALSKRTNERYFADNFVSPVPGAAISGFGKRSIFNGQPRKPHSGADLRAKTGTPVAAPAKGKVVLTGDFFFNGKTVVLDHGYGLISYYIHLSAINVKEGKTVSKGGILGLVGATGRASGPHLHWGVKVYNVAVDPFSLVDLDVAKWLKEKTISGS